ncbi:MAG: single-stranded DNA-binding protein, partial [Mycoplasmatales bacterium]
MVNTVVLVGRITKDPELRHSTSGSSVCNFSLAINRTFKNQAGEYDADFINCVAF